MRRPASRSLVLHAAALVCACGGDEPDAPRPNVLLVSLDSTRRDILSCYGRSSPHAPDVATSPAIDELAAEGVRFEQAYATTSWTLPSHMTLFTGLPELVHAVELDELELSRRRIVLAEELREKGYRTAGFYTGPYLDPAYGFGRGFERYEAAWGEDLAAAIEAEAALRARIATGEPPPDPAELSETLLRVERESHRDVTSEQVTDLALEELRAMQASGRPWFLFVHYFDPHYDYVPPAPYDARFDPDYAGALDGHDFSENPAISVPAARPGDWTRRERRVSPRDLEHVRALYDGELAWTDRQLGRLLDELRASGALDRTIVVVTADHGDEFFEHGNIGHRKNLHEESIRTPLLIRYPPRLPAGKAVAGVVTLTDLLATILDLAGLEPAKGTLSKSLVPLATGEEDGGARWALGRLVDVRQLKSIEGASGLFTSIEECFLRWPIKVRRRRAWVDPTGPIPPEKLAPLRASAEAERGRDAVLAWIDLDRNPMEELAAYSGDFSDPRARAALEEFQRVYERLLDLRVRPELAAGDSAVQKSLQDGLGYGGGGDVQLDDEMIERFTIGPPGKR